MLTVTFKDLLAADPGIHNWRKLNGQHCDWLHDSCTIAGILTSYGVYDAMFACRVHDEKRFESWLNSLPKTTRLNKRSRTIQLPGKVYVNEDVFMVEFNKYIEGDNNVNNNAE